MKVAQSHVMRHKTANGEYTQEKYSVAPAVFTCNTFKKYMSWKKHHQQFWKNILHRCYVQEQ